MTVAVEMGETFTPSDLPERWGRRSLRAGSGERRERIMTIWDEVKHSVEDISEVAREVANLLAEKTDEISREGKLKLEIFNLQRRVRAEETRLGHRTFLLWMEDRDALPAKDETASGCLSALKELTERIEALKKELETSKAQEKGEKREGGE